MILPFRFYVPADGMSAAAENRTSARFDWQLAKKIYHFLRYYNAPTGDILKATNGPKPGQPIPFRRSTTPPQGTKPSKIRDVNFTVGRLVFATLLRRWFPKRLNSCDASPHQIIPMLGDCLLCIRSKLESVFVN